MTEHHADVLIVGGGLGGVAAALAAARMGRTVILTEETDWLGGQLTTQGVPFDEHPWIEFAGRTQSYAALREGIRNYYRAHYPLTPAARADRFLNPGAPLVSRLGCEPRVGVAVLEAMLAPYRAAGLVETLMRHKPVEVSMNGDRAEGVVLVDLERGGTRQISAPYILDATELGDLLPLAGVEYVSGAESQSETGEPSALQGPADPLCMQAITHTFALDYRPGEDHTIDRPRDYDFWRTYQAEFETGPHLSFERPWLTYSLFPEPGVPHGQGTFSLWLYRRVLYKGHFPEGFVASDISIANWSQNDYWLGPIIEVPEEEAQKHLEGARQVSLSALYWLQTEAPRPDGGVGYPGLRLRPDVMGTTDGFAKYPYIRESRRIKAEFTVLEQHLGMAARPGASGAEPFHDSVGIGSYRIDMHGVTPGRKGLSGPSWPFQIPLGALLPVRVENLLPANKNLGVTHVTNSCFRLHPIEWNIGEAAGALAAFCLQRGLVPRQVRNTPAHLADFQALLVRHGIDLQWPKFEEGTSYYRWASKQPGWTWGESDAVV